MPLRVTIPYGQLVDHGNWEEWEEVGSTDFLISYDGSIKGVDYDIEEEQMLAFMTGAGPDNRLKFVQKFLDGGGPELVTRLLKSIGPNEFLDALWLYGLDAFLDGAEMPEDEESVLLARLLDYVYVYTLVVDIDPTATDRKKVLALCERIRELVPPEEIKVEKKSNFENESKEGYIKSSVSYDFELRIYDRHILTFKTKIIKRIWDPFNFQYDFRVKTNTDKIPCGEQVIQGLRLKFPEADISPGGVAPPEIPRVDPHGYWVLLYIPPEHRTISVENAKQILRFGTHTDALRARQLAMKVLQGHSDEKDAANGWMLVTAQFLRRYNILRILEVAAYTVGRDEDDDEWKWRQWRLDQNRTIPHRGHLPGRKIVPKP